MSHTAISALNSQYSDNNISIEEISMTIIVGMKSPAVGMTTGALNFIEVDASNQSVINKLIERLDFFVSLNYYHSVLQ
ncbi:hypothetical protein [Candidatus Stoquefichus sp. SB1]|uniref:hypothetical protein n=1 Tax=Candidatus Stoquefichus sp. SB1 TaxID=1658109 RepID=UPI0012FE9841|nr:hypothetical protein [Candidatus Stoquefichus sp. SB1]